MSTSSVTSIEAHSTPLRSATYTIISVSLYGRIVGQCPSKGTFRLRILQNPLLQVDPKDVPICSDFALLFHEQKKEKKLCNCYLLLAICYCYLSLLSVIDCSVIGYLLGNLQRSEESRLSSKYPLANL